MKKTLKMNDIYVTIGGENLRFCWPANFADPADLILDVKSTTCAGLQKIFVFRF